MIQSFIVWITSRCFCILGLPDRFVSVPARYARRFFPSIRWSRFPNLFFLDRLLEVDPLAVKMDRFSQELVSPLSKSARVSAHSGALSILEGSLGVSAHIT